MPLEETCYFKLDIWIKLISIKHFQVSCPVNESNTPVIFTVLLKHEIYLQTYIWYKNKAHDMEMIVMWTRDNCPVSCTQISSSTARTTMSDSLEPRNNGEEINWLTLNASSLYCGMRSIVEKNQIKNKHLINHLYKLNYTSSIDLDQAEYPDHLYIKYRFENNYRHHINSIFSR